MKRGFLLAVTVFAPLWLGNLCAEGDSESAAVKTMRDTFEPTGQRAPGDHLHKTEFTSHNAVWEATTNILLADRLSKGAISVTDNLLFVARTKVPAEGRIVRIEASLRPVAMEEAPGGFVAIGFGNAPLYNITWVKGLFLVLYADGKAAVLMHPAGADPAADPNKDVPTSLGSKKVAGYEAGSWNRVVLEYDRERNAVSAWINDEPIVERLALGAKNFVPEVTVAGLSGFHDKAGESVASDFSLILK